MNKEFIDMIIEASHKNLSLIMDNSDEVAFMKTLENRNLVSFIETHSIGDNYPVYEDIRLTSDGILYLENFKTKL